MIGNGNPPKRASVIIPNYNHARYVGQAIESALAVDWPDVEVIVVDDGSADESREVIRSFRDRGVIDIFQENSGQLIACNRGFSASTGDLIIFLDSDDLIAPTLIKRALEEWRPNVSKFQFQMAIIDSEGRPLGRVFPRYTAAATPAKMREWMLRAGAYPTPPGSGNLYTREFLEKIFPLEWGINGFSDSFCLPAAPFLGDVVAIPEPLVLYRIHGGNAVAMARLKVENFSKELITAIERHKYAVRVASIGGFEVSGEALRNNLQYQSLRLASFLLCPERHPIDADTRFKILTDVLRGFATPQGNSVRAQCATTIWLLMAAVLPLRIARSMMEWRFVPASRPVWLQDMIRTL
jgi:glycosyltransferase involved in cell wall biosynthesis